MKTLDSEVYSFFSKVPDEVLEKFAHARYMSDTFDKFNYVPNYSNDFCDYHNWKTKYLNDISNLISQQYAGLPVFEEFDDSKAIEDDSDWLEEHCLKDIGMEKTRAIPHKEISNLAWEMLLLRRGSKFSNLSMEQIETEIKSFKKSIERLPELQQRDEKYKKDSKYNIDYFDKVDIKNFLKRKAILNEYIGNESKQNIESKISILKYKREQGEIEAGIDGHKQLIELLFEKERVDEDDLNEMSQLPVAFIEESLNEGLQEKEANKFTQKVKNFFAKIFSKAKKLPDSTPYVSNEENYSKYDNKGQTFLGNIHIEPEKSSVYKGKDTVGKKEKNQRKDRERT